MLLSSISTLCGKTTLCRCPRKMRKRRVKVPWRLTHLTQQFDDIAWSLIHPDRGVRYPLRNTKTKYNTLYNGNLKLCARRTASTIDHFVRLTLSCITIQCKAGILYYILFVWVWQFAADICVVDALRSTCKNVKTLVVELYSYFSICNCVSKHNQWRYLEYRYSQ